MCVCAQRRSLVDTPVPVMITEVKQRWDWLVLGCVTAMGQRERNENFSIPSLLSCGVALKSANRSVLC